MDWIFEHIQVIAIVAGVIAYWINQRKRHKAGESADYDGDGIPDVPQTRKLGDRENPDAAQSERERQIREEMLRKIAERRGGGSPPALPPDLPAPARRAPAQPLEAPRPASSSPLEEMLRRAADALRRNEEAARAEAAAAEKAERRRLRRLREQALALEEARRQETAKAAAIAAHESPLIEFRRENLIRRALLQDLRGAGNLRRAIVLREVIGPPVGLSRR
ncbi:MAG: hypothetical protein KBA71_08260 [Opitutaceae bacterium]|nr:hypothetical protein [Opitutaceae bacterium]